MSLVNLLFIKACNFCYSWDLCKIIMTFVYTSGFTRGKFHGALASTWIMTNSMLPPCSTLNDLDDDHGHDAKIEEHGARRSRGRGVLAVGKQQTRLTPHNKFGYECKDSCVYPCRHSVNSTSQTLIFMLFIYIFIYNRNMSGGRYGHYGDCGEKLNLIAHFISPAFLGCTATADTMNNCKSS